jgi:predicted DNA-binding transcriptional regulator AlpA
VPHSRVSLLSSSTSALASEAAGTYPSSEFVDRSEAAALLGVSPRTLDRWHALRLGPPRVKYGRQVRYRLPAVMEWLLQHEVSAPAQLQPRRARR